MPERLNTRRGPESSSLSPLLIRCFFAGGSFPESSLTARDFLSKGDRNGLLNMTDAGQPLRRTKLSILDSRTRLKVQRYINFDAMHVLFCLTALKFERLTKFAQLL